ncbi:hypothetical protein A8140_08330 [Vibrio campbellii CAIM 519 = NBRC 15631 = ATCC 25920]|nr:hypothetical protein A8140_08330 [Vibrio campbellii CAIM 519 = NBRC 15631 = ATCC 25920]ELU49520.1 hypothetical protein B878_22901 [Vibrio campbellii CAIM 519 = NBRC 15631 = ATCC 25920]
MLCKSLQKPYKIEASYLVEGAKNLSKHVFKLFFLKERINKLGIMNAILERLNILVRPHQSHSVRCS